MAVKTARRDANEAARPAGFLDRDGVINIDRGYAFQPDQLELTPTAADGIRLLNDADYRVIVVTNQSGIARGYYGIAEVEAFHRHLQAELARACAWIDAFYFCPYHPEGRIADFTRDHFDRKPNPGMILRAIDEWQILRAGSFLVGDKPSDLVAAAAAGIEGVLVTKDDCDLAAVVRSRLNS